MDPAFVVLVLQLLYILNATQGKSSADKKLSNKNCFLQ